MCSIRLHENRRPLPNNSTKFRKYANGGDPIVNTIHLHHFSDKKKHIQCCRPCQLNARGRLQRCSVWINRNVMQDTLQTSPFTLSIHSFCSSIGQLAMLSWSDEHHLVMKIIRSVSHPQPSSPSRFDAFVFIHFRLDIFLPSRFVYPSTLDPCLSLISLVRNVHR